MIMFMTIQKIMCCMLLMTMMVRISNLVYEVVGGREEGHMDDNDDDL